jgi:uncharacterized membrane protein YkvA (DUF1232 family)
MLAEQTFYCQPPSGGRAIIGDHFKSVLGARHHVNVTGRLRYLRLARLVWRLPTYARLVWGLLRDPRTPVPLKGLLAAGLAYVLVPLDVVPDAVPILGQADDLTVLLLVLDLFIANAPREVREEHMERARSGTAQLDSDLARLRLLLGDRYDQIRDNLPELLDRYGRLREPGNVKRVLRDWRTRRMRSARAEPDPAILDR